MKRYIQSVNIFPSQNQRSHYCTLVWGHACDTRDVPQYPHLVPQDNLQLGEAAYIVFQVLSSKNIELTDNTENFQRLYLALEAVIDDHREYGSAGEGSLWSRLAVYVEAVLKNLFIELSMQVKRSDWSSHILDEAKFYKLS